MVNGKLKCADPIALRHIPAWRPVGDGYGFLFLFSIITSIVHIPCPQGVCETFLRMLSRFTFPPLDGSVYYARPSHLHTNPLSILSADPSHSLYVTRFVVLPLYRTLHLLSLASQLFSVLIAFG